VDPLTLFGVVAVSLMLVFSRARAPLALVRAGLCRGLRAGLGVRFPAGGLALGIIEAIWSLVALRRWLTTPPATPRA
jgi:hypothetical protein